MRRILVILLAVGLTLATPSTVAAGPTTGDGGPGASGAAAPALVVKQRIGGLDAVWDVQRLPDARLLLTERDKARLWLWKPGRLQRVNFPRTTVWVGGETGLMSLAVDPAFTQNRRFYTCQGGKRSGKPEIQVRAWRLSPNSKRAVAKGVLLRGIRAATIHGGCRLQIDRVDGALWVSTGDAAIGKAPRDLTSLNGKTLRLSRTTGKPWPANPWIDAANRQQRYVVSYGHRNVQGLAQRNDRTMWSVEHGPDRDDEINLVEPGGDYGWHPVPGYDQSVPMTDQSLPGTQVDAKWTSGVPTLATSGAAWVRGSQWGSLEGTLAVATLKSSRLIFYRFDADGDFVSSTVGVRGRGRLRSVTQLPGGTLLVTTDRDNGSDGVLFVRPR